MRTKIPAILFLSLCALGVSAQEHPNVAKGVGAVMGSATDLDTINPFNGNLLLRLPIGQSYPVNAGMSYQLVLTYNSQVWEHETYDEETRVIPARGNNAGLGWALHLGRLNPPQLEFGSAPSPDFNRNTYLAPDGGIHTFYPTLHEGEAATSGTEYTRDGTYLRLKTATRQIEFPDGSTHTFSSLTNGYLTRIEDRFGNFVQVDYQDCFPSCVPATPANAHRWQISDTQGRVHRIDLRETFQPGQPLVVTQVDLQAFGGARAVWKLIYNDSTDDQSNTGSPVPLTGCRGTDNYSVWFLTRVVRPDSSTWQIPLAGYFASNIPGDFNNPCKTGLIKQLRLPTLGQIDWDYMLYKFPSTSTNRNIWQRSTGVGTRRLLDAASSSIGQWTYTSVLSGGTTAHEKLLTNSVTDPLGNKISRYFSVCVANCTDTTDGPYEYGVAVGRDAGTDGAGRFVSNQVFDSVGTLLRTTYARYEHDVPSASSTVTERSRLNQRMASQRLKFDDDPAGTYADDTFSDFDGLGHYRRKDSNGNFPGNNVRSNHVHYNPGVGTYGQAGYAPWSSASPWVINTYLFAWDQESGKIQYRIPCYEASTGFLQRLRILKNSGAAEHANDVLQVFQRNAAGNVTTESHYGGDTQSLAVNACGLTPPASAVYQFTHTYAGGVRSKTSATVGTALNLMDLTVDASTGLPSSSRDAAGKQTGYSYDTLGRMTTIDPADDLLTVASYCTATSVPACPAGVRAQVIAARKATAGGAEVTAVRSRFDDWGRLISDEVRMPPAGNYAARNYTFNALGWRTYASEQGSGPGTTFLNFDAFGRPRTVRPPDGASHDVTLAYEGIRKVTQTVKVATSTSGETNAATIEIYDRFGRLYEVTEPNNVKTRHDYDVGHRLVKVCQGATGTGTGTCGQTRLFNYDLRGFLLSEQHPEKGVSGNGTVTWSNYDARGHALRVADGSSDLTFTYDKAERLTNVRETGGAQRTLKTFTYATANFTDAAGTDWRKGKLTSSSRFNYVGAPFNATAEVRDTYAYRGTEGRASEQTRQMFVNGVDEEKFTTTYAWEGLGMISSIGYPDCVFGDCVASDTARNVSFGYSYGLLTSVPGYTGTALGVSEITYHANGLVHQVPHSNGVLFTQQNDPNGIARPAGMTAANGTTTLWTAGTHAYDGAGNLKAIGAQTFVYDNLSRLTQGNISGGSQSYTYDNYGNIQSVTTDGVLLNTPTSAGTNRLTAGGYDASGNLTSWNGAGYQYDAFNLLSRFTSGSEDWVYVYGPDDERFWSYKTDGTGSIWALRDLEGTVLRQYNSHLGWSNYEDYIYRDDKLLANYLSGGQRRHFDVDHLGSVRLVTNLAGNQVGFHRYFPFGKENTTLQEGDRMKFTGHERDLASLLGDGDDLDYMHARHFSPLTGRFLSTDPVGGIASFPQSWNRYGYVMGRAMTFTDPQGLIFGRAFPPVGMTVYDIGYGDTITVTTTAWNGTTTNPFTGVWGLGSLMSGSSFFQSLGMGDLMLLDRSDFSWDRTRSLTGQGLGAYVDGLIPFVNPLADAEVYNPDEVGMASMEVVGEVVATVAGTGGAASKAHKAFKAGREIKFGKNLRIAPWGNRTGHKYGRWPHYHRRGKLGPNGQPGPGQGIGRHRPWEPPAPGQPWRSRF
ncbi:MAG TPA: RHS repeat-associated core domain-containing protein [Thermoanaerobaculia bacterium]|nr:RHS repeat-associated core domain-containing protein [Thermoanaerobaculia bacterium]